MTDFSRPDDPPPTFEPPRSGAAPPTYIPWSTAAIASVVGSLLFFCPIIPVLVGLICGFVGLRATSGGRARGRGLAIAGILIWLIVGAGQAYLGFFFYITTIRLIEVTDQGINSFRVSSEALDEVLTPLHGDLASSDFQAEVSREQLHAWFEDVLGQHGQLMEIVQTGRPARVKEEEGRREDILFTIEIRGRFIQGPATMRLTMLGEDADTRGIIWKIDDLEVAGSSARTFAARASELPSLPDDRLADDSTP